MDDGKTPEDQLLRLARIVGNDWKEGKYYDEAEKSIKGQWDKVIWPLIQGSNFGVVVELAAGHGRNTAQLSPLAGKIIAVDINQTNLDFMRARFAEAGVANVELMLTDGTSLSGVPDASVNFIYCFDAMVHFDSDVVRSYIREFSRVLVPGGRGFVHYSNYTGNPTGSYREHRGWRNFMSRELFEHWLFKDGLKVLRSEYILAVVQFVPAGTEGADAVTLFEKPAPAS